MYQPFDANEWTGRVDAEEGPGGRRWHQVVRGLPSDEAGVVLLGFACDAGVARNHGRVGAAAGPSALREQLGNVPATLSVPLYDAGTVAVDRARAEALEDGQSEYGSLVARMLAGGNAVIGLGGGHEIAWASYCGLRDQLASVPGASTSVGVLNFDAHLDVRRPDPAGTSGTGFRQILTDAGPNSSQHVRYACVGVSAAANTAALFDYAQLQSVALLHDTECSPDAVRVFVEEFVRGVDELYLTICLDVLPAAVTPGVSAPAALGVAPATIIAGIRAAGDACRDAGTRIRVADVAELNPSYDIDARTARTAARLVFELARMLAR